MNIFGKKKAAPKPASTADTAAVVAELQDKVKMLEKRQDFVQKKIEQQLKEARVHSQKKDKKRAMMCLKRKKLYEKEIEKMQGAMLTLEQQVMYLQSATVNVEVFRGITKGKDQLASIHGELDPEKVDDVMEDIAEQMATADEISEALAHPVGGDVADDDDILAELDELEGEWMEEKMMGVEGAPTTPVGPVAAAAGAAAVAPVAASAPVLPEAPTGDVAVAAGAGAGAGAGGDASADELRALAELEAEMAM